MLSLMEVIIALKRISMFSSIHGEGLKRLSVVIREKNVRQGEVVFSENELGDEMYLVYDGKILIYYEIAGHEEPLQIIESSGFFGEMAIIDERPRSASARAEKDSMLLVLHRNDFRAAVLDYPDMAFAVFKELSQRLRQADERIRALATELRRAHREIES
jgi:CRP-like cAMP-binding protein